MSLERKGHCKGSNGGDSGASCASFVKGRGLATAEPLCSFVSTIGGWGNCGIYGGIGLRGDRERGDMVVRYMALGSGGGRVGYCGGGEGGEC